MLEIEPVDFETVLPIWRDQLWPGRESPIESHSAMCWPNTTKYSMAVFDQPAQFFAIKDDNKIIGVNSCHWVEHTWWRERGIWVHPDHRGQGIGLKLVQRACEAAKQNGATLIWALPRLTSMNMFRKAGYIQVSEPRKTETADANVYAVCVLGR